VERKYEADFEFKPKETIELDHEQSKKSLGEIYEEEYLKTKQGTTGSTEKLQQAHASIKRQFDALCTKLDSLTNFYFTPKPVCFSLFPAFSFFFLFPDPQLRPPLNVAEKGH